MKGILTKKQRAFYEAIEDFMDEYGESPTNTELQLLTGAKSPRSVTQYLDALEEKGYLYRRPSEKRGIVLTRDEVGVVADFFSVPVIASAGCDEGNVFAEERVEEYVDVDRALVPRGKKPQDMVVIRAVGDSMTDAGINNGDYVLAEKLQPGEARESDRVIALVNNTLVIKSIHFSDNCVVLRPQSHNKRYRPIIARENLSIPARVVDVIRMRQSEELSYEPVGDDTQHTRYN